MQRAPEVHVHRLLIIALGHVLDGPDLDDAGVVDQHVDGAEGFDGGTDQRFDVLADADVARGRLDVRRAAAAQVRLRGAQLFFIAAGDDQSSAFVRETPRQQQSQPARSAGDDHNFPREIDAPIPPRRQPRRAVHSQPDPR